MRRLSLLAAFAITGCHHNTYPDCSLQQANGAAIAWQRAPGNAIEGRVVGIDGKPIETAMVSVDGTSRYRTTDKAGRFTFQALQPGVYEVTVRIIGYGRLSRAITLDPGYGAELTAVLERQILRLTDECGFAMGVARPWWKFW